MNPKSKTPNPEPETQNPKSHPGCIRIFTAHAVQGNLFTRKSVKAEFIQLCSCHFLRFAFQLFHFGGNVVLKFQHTLPRFLRLQFSSWLQQWIQKARSQEQSGKEPFMTNSNIQIQVKEASKKWDTVRWQTNFFCNGLLD